MSIEIDWQALAHGPAGDRLAESIRDFIDARFRTLALPKLIRSLRCHSFAFGSVPPEIVIRDVTDPRREFYEDDDDSDGSEPRPVPAPTPSLPILTSTPGTLGPTSNLSYFHLPLSAAAGAPMFGPSHRLPECHSPEPRKHHGDDGSNVAPSRSPQNADADEEDIQITFSIFYKGDLSLSLAADIFLDYPISSFVGIPLKLTITSLSFSGTGILAYLKSRRSVSVSFLSENLEGNGDGTEGEGVVIEMAISSEMGDDENTLKNVGKIEKFVLKEVKRAFEDEVVWPSFWTFLV